MFFHSIAMVANSLQAKAMKRSSSYYTEKLLGLTVQKMLKAWTASAEAANLAALAKLVFPYILINLHTKRIFIPSKRDQKFAARKQSYHLLHGKAIFNN